MDDPIRLVIYGAWAFGSLAIWGRVLGLGLRSYRTWRDLRARRELLADFALFLVALSSCLSIVLLVIGQQGTGIRGFMLALALGGFTGAGIVLATFTGHGKKRRRKGTP